MMQGKRWYAIRTKPRAEKKAEEALKVKGIEVYMPVQKTLRQWSDRKKWIWEPVLKSYLFVCVEAREIDLVRFTHGVSGFIVFGGVPASIPEAQIRLLKMLVEQQYDLEFATENIAPGEMVEILSGNLKGFQGEMVERRGKHKLLIRIDTLEFPLLVNVPKVNIKRLRSVSGQ